MFGRMGRFFNRRVARPFQSKTTLRTQSSHALLALLLGSGMVAMLVLPLVLLPVKRAFSATPPPLSVKATANTTTAPVSPAVKHHRLRLADIGVPASGFTLKGIYGRQAVRFLWPSTWQARPSSRIRLMLRHSKALTPRTSVTVVLNGHPLGTFFPVRPNMPNPVTLQIPLRPAVLKPVNQLSVELSQHIGNPCTEPPDDPGLWTTLLPDSTITLDYTEQRSAQTRSAVSLSRFPKALLADPSAQTARLGMTTPATAVSDESLNAMAIVLTTLGQQRPHQATRLHWLPKTTRSSSVRDMPTLMIGTPTEQPLIRQALRHVKHASLVALSRTSKGTMQWTDPRTGTPLAADEGVLWAPMIPGQPDNLLIVSGNGPAGVLKAARFLSTPAARRLVSGRTARIRTLQPATPAATASGSQPFPLPGHIMGAGETRLAALAPATPTMWGTQPQPLSYRIGRAPDLWLDGTGSGVGIKTVYSYGAQLHPGRSKLEVLWNGLAIGSIALARPEGESQAEAFIRIPTSDFHDANTLAYRFHLAPATDTRPAQGVCPPLSRRHLWGTIHPTTSVSLSAKQQAALPDISLLKTGMFPLTRPADFSNLAMVLPDAPTDSDIRAMLSVALRIGRSTPLPSMDLDRSLPPERWQPGPGYRNQMMVVRAGHLRDAIRRNRHVVVIGQSDQQAVFSAFRSRLRLLKSPNTLDSTPPTTTPITAQWARPLAELDYDGTQGVVEELISPWNVQRVALLISGATPQAVTLAGNAFARDDWFERIHESNLMTIDAGGPKAIVALQRGEARLWRTGGSDGRSGDGGFQMPMIAWGLITLLSLLGVISVGRFLMKSRKKAP